MLLHTCTLYSSLDFDAIIGRRRRTTVAASTRGTVPFDAFGGSTSRTNDLARFAWSPHNPFPHRFVDIHDTNPRFQAAARAAAARAAAARAAAARASHTDSGPQLTSSGASIRSGKDDENNSKDQTGRDGSPTSPGSISWLNAIAVFASKTLRRIRTIIVDTKFWFLVTTLGSMVLYVSTETYVMTKRHGAQSFALCL